MKSVTALAFLALVAFSAVIVAGAKYPVGVIPNRYIAVFKSETTYAQRQAFKNSQATAAGTTIFAEWDFQDFHGFAVEMPAVRAVALKDNSLLASFEPDQYVHKYQGGQCVIQRGATWGINRISERAIELNGEYDYDNTGLGVDAYIIDTGVLITHNEFRNGAASRATWGANFADSTNQDCNGHGTHVAGTVGGNVYGVAKNASIIAVKVLDCFGSGSFAGVINGINWAATQKTSRGRPSVANLSLGGGFNAGVNAAIANLVKAGVVTAVAAGNDNYDACLYSPASAPEAISTGATAVTSDIFGDQSDSRSTFSNYGKCVHIFAPGTSITSAWIGSNTATLTISGTSMAAPHVCGAAAVYLQANPSATPAQVKTAMTTDSTDNAITLNCGSNTVCSASPNKLLFSACASKQ